MRTVLIFCLLGLIPALIAAALLLQNGVNVDSTVSALGAVAVLSLLGGLALLIQSSSHARKLARSANLLSAGKRKEAQRLSKTAPAELLQVEQSLRSLVAEADTSKRNFAELVTKVKQYSAKMQQLKEKLKRESVLRAYLGRYVGNDVIEQIILSQQDDPLKNERTEATLLFADIRSFTTLSENMSPEEIISMLNEYFDAMVSIIFKHDGILDKFVGDELMAVFPSKKDKAGAALNAVHAGQEMQEKISVLMQERNARGLPVFQVGIGINTGSVVVGNVGARNRMDYTVIGDTVNVAARLEQIAEGQEILVGNLTRDYCKHAVLMREKGEISVKNREEPVKCYEIVKKISGFK